MATILEVLNNVKAINLRKAVPDIILETKEAIANAQAVQMFSGHKSDGSDITPEYAESTIEIKKQKGQPTDRVTGRDTGSMQEHIEVYMKQDRFVIISTDPKTADFIKRYGPKVFGLNTQYLQDYGRDYFRPKLKAHFENVGKLILR